MTAPARDPWPTPHPAWHDPPWLLSGRVVTAWFMVPWEILERSLSPDLRPEPTDEVRIRLRFYELEFEVLGRHPGQPLAPIRGAFKEAVVGFPAHARGVDGESSMFMWTDSDTYLMWAREAFGWPLLKGEVSLEGSVWTTTDMLGSSGRATVQTEHGTASLLEGVVRERSETPLTAPCWLTPRRHLTGPPTAIPETRDLLAVWPTIRQPGSRYSGTGRVALEFTDGHPLSSLSEREAELDILDSFELVVAENIKVL